MCLIAFSWLPEQGRLLLLANRDEFYARPTVAAHWWPEQPYLWAGRDLKARGTWLGVNRAGRFAALTNVREGKMQLGKRSRGELVSGFLSCDLSGENYLAKVLNQGNDYAGFNLLLGDMHHGELWYGANREGGAARLLSAGHYGLSNGLLDEPWPKVERLKQGLAEMGTLYENDITLIERSALALLSDPLQAPIERLPDTGVASELELLLSSVFIHSASYDYGTRAQTVLAIKQNEANVIEQSRGSDGVVREINRAHFTF